VSRDMCSTPDLTRGNRGDSSAGVANTIAGTTIANSPRNGASTNGHNS
jgi:hypothetical protein